MEGTGGRSALAPEEREAEAAYPHKVQPAVFLVAHELPPEVIDDSVDDDGNDHGKASAGHEGGTKHG